MVTVVYENYEEVKVMVSPYFNNNTGRKNINVDDMLFEIQRDSENGRLCFLVRHKSETAKLEFSSVAKYL